MWTKKGLLRIQPIADSCDGSGRSATVHYKSGIVPGQSRLYRRSTISLPMIDLAATLTVLRGLVVYPDGSYTGGLKGSRISWLRVISWRENYFRAGGWGAKDYESEIR